MDTNQLEQAQPGIAAQIRPDKVRAMPKNKAGGRPHSFIKILAR